MKFTRFEQTCDVPVRHVDGFVPVDGAVSLFPSRLFFRGVENLLREPSGSGLFDGSLLPL